MGLERFSDYRDETLLGKRLTENTEYSKGLESEHGELELKSIRESAILMVIRNFRASVTPRTNNIALTFRADNPVLAQDVMNNIIELFLEQHIKAYASLASPEFFRDRSEKLLKLLEAQEDNLKKFFAEHNITSMEQQKLDLGTQISLIHSTISEDTANTKALMARTLSLETEFEKLSVEAEASGSGSENDSDMSALISNIRQLKITAQSEYEGQVAREGSLSQVLKKYQDELAQLVSLEVPLKRLERKVELAENEYRNNLENYQLAAAHKELDLQRVSNIAVIQPATMPLVPIGPKRKLMIALGALLGLFGGVGLVLLCDYMDESLRTTEEAEKHLGLPVLASICYKTSDEPVTESSYSCFAQDLAVLCNNALPLACDSHGRALQFIGSQKGEGTSTIVRALARALVEDRGERVLLVNNETDIPDDKTVLDVTPIGDLSEVFKGSRPIHDAISQVGQTNLFESRFAPNSLSLDVLSNSEKFKSAFHDLKSRFDWILFDSSPLNSAPQTATLFPYVAGVILIVDAGSTRGPVVKSVCDRIVRHNGNILGVVLNKKRYYIPKFLYDAL
ncbi:GumC family protein [Candidatus Hydrogenedentota bacterium]